MSIINEALRKLQNQISSNELSQSPHINPSVEKITPTTSQEERYQTVMTEDRQSIENTNQQKTSENTQESHLAIVLIILCLLTGLFVPIFNKQSIIALTRQQLNQLTRHFQKPQAIQLEQKTYSPRLTTNSNPTPAPEPQPSAISKAISTSSNSALKTSSISPLPPSPTTTAPKSNRTQSRLIVNGILTQGEKNLVLIDGQIYEEGDTVEGIQIIKITSKGVNIREDGEEKFVKVMGL